MTYVYIKSEPQLYTVGHYDPTGKWHTDSDHNDRNEAAARAHYLNGGTDRRARDIEEAARALLACAGRAEHWTDNERQGAFYLRTALDGKASDFPDNWASGESDPI